MSHQLEREVKLLLRREHVLLGAALSSREIRQVYLLTGQGTIRVRASQAAPGEPLAHELTLKFDRGAETSSEYTLPLAPDLGPRLYAEALERGFPEIAKTRYLMPAGGEGMQGLVYEVDVFTGRFDFLTLGELEYPGAARPPGLATRPDWYPEGPWPVDVSEHGGFQNSRLVGMDAAAVEATRREFERLLAGD